ncbi:MAG: hypothetical protein AB7U61_13910, partial [Methylocystis sp.]
MASFAIPAWAVSVTQWMNVYGPIGWVASGMAGLLCGAIVILVVNLVVLSRIRINATRIFYRDRD